MFQKLCFLIGVVAVSMLPFTSGVRATDLSHTIAGLVSDGTASIPYTFSNRREKHRGRRCRSFYFCREWVIGARTM